MGTRQNILFALYMYMRVFLGCVYMLHLASEHTLLNKSQNNQSLLGKLLSTSKRALRKAFVLQGD